MEKTILDLYINQNLQIAVIARKLKITTEDVYKILNENGYLASKGRKKDWVLKVKEASEYYKNNQKTSIRKTAEMFDISEDSFSRALKEYGIDTTRKLNSYSFDEHVFDFIDSEEKAYWLGFIFADGYISSSPLKDQNKKYIFEICLALIDTGHLFKFDSFVKTEKPKVKVYDYLDNNGNKKQHSKWNICNQHLWETLNAHGCTPNKSLTLMYPKNIPEKLKKHFLRGYFDGDGSFGIYGSKCKFGELSLSCVGTKDMLENMFSGFNLNMYHHEGHSPETLTVNATANKAKLILDYMYKDSTIYLDRKFNKYLEVCRLWEKSHRLLQGNIGEEPEKENTEISIETKESVPS